MLMNFLNWREDFEAVQNQLSFQYHLHSATTSASTVVHRSRVKAMKLVLSQTGSGIGTGRHCYSAPALPLELGEDHSIALGRAALSKFQEVCHNETDDYLEFAPYMAELPLTAQQLDHMDIYFLATDQNSISTPIYYYYPDHSSLERFKMWNSTHTNQLFPSYLNGLRDGDPSSSVQGVFICVANLYRAQKLFGDRGYRLAMLRAGGIAERLKRAALQIPEIQRVLITADFMDGEVNRLLDLDGLSEAAMVCVTLHA